MHYIAKNPKNAKVYQKMIKRCKYFFVKNPILVLSHLSHSQNGWSTWVNETWKSIDINKISAKLWITGLLHVSPANVSNDSVVSSIISKIYQCDFKRLSLDNQVISLNEFIFLCLSAKYLTLERVTVKNNDGTVVAFENIIERLPQLIFFIFYSFTNPSNNTSKTSFKELWKNPHLSNYDRFYLKNIPENFEIDCFYTYMKKNKKTRVDLEFSDEVSEEYQIRLEAIIDEIIATKNHEYKPPLINFPGIDQEKYSKLFDISSG
uniref:Uncharacterized protein n=1 Tax=Panagrolaimus superbus TaxID=310955 RepID=A0A914Z2W4_9BILA